HNSDLTEQKGSPYESVSPWTCISPHLPCPSSSGPSAPCSSIPFFSFSLQHMDRGSTKLMPPKTQIGPNHKYYTR
uniref:Uncharacterized protein n=1 Tax=Aegilops tauschii subsp. strangulata TaxID=200361 RepID=A0A453MRF0_AEGTS